MTNHNTIHVLHEDVDDVLKIIEKSFNIKFENGELKDIKTFGEIITHILSKLDFEEQEDCTSQQAFYKLKKNILNISDVHIEILPKTLLNNIFPKENRKVKIRALESSLDMTLNIFRPKVLVSSVLIFMIIVFLIIIIFDSKIGLIGFIMSVSSLIFAYKIGIEFNIKTAGDLADKMSKEFYLKSRRNNETINKKEIKAKIESIFIEYLGLDKEPIPDDTIFKLE